MCLCVCVRVYMVVFVGVRESMCARKSDRKLSNSLKEIATSFSFTSRQKTNFQHPKGSCTYIHMCVYIFIYTST